MIDPNPSGVKSGHAMPFTLIEQLRGAMGRTVSIRPTKGEPVIGTLIATNHDAVTLEERSGRVTTVMRWHIGSIAVEPGDAR